MWRVCQFVVATHRGPRWLTAQALLDDICLEDEIGSKGFANCLGNGRYGFRSRRFPNTATAQHGHTVASRQPPSVSVLAGLNTERKEGKM